MYPLNQKWPIETAVQLACLLEAYAPKLGNVHPAASFSDVNFADFVASGIAIAPCFSTAAERPVGVMVLDAVQQMRSAAASNTHLGTILLFGPLAKAAATCQATTLPELRQATRAVLNTLDADDSQQVYEAIRAASPGGLGKTQTADLSQQAPQCLVSAMASAPAQDAVARQYVNGFADVFDLLLPWLDAAVLQSDSAAEAICKLQLRWLAHEVDGLIVRKSGFDQAKNVQAKAAEVLDALESQNQPNRPSSWIHSQGWCELDRMLRSCGNRFNPGTTADLIAAALFVKLLTED